MSVFTGSKKQESEVDLSGLASPATAASEPAESKKAPVPAALLTPEAQAFMNASISQAVKEVFAGLGPMLQSISLTPEKLAAAEALRRAPDPKLVEREQRERKLMRAEQEENHTNLLRLQAACPHKYPRGLLVSLVSNYPDRMPRGVCHLCQTFFEPKRWVIGAPTAEEPRGHAHIADAHPLYSIVREVAMTKGA